MAQARSTSLCVLVLALCRRRLGCCGPFFPPGLCFLVLCFGMWLFDPRHCVCAMQMVGLKSAAVLSCCLVRSCGALTPLLVSCRALNSRAYLQDLMCLKGGGAVCPVFAAL